MQYHSLINSSALAKQMPLQFPTHATSPTDPTIDSQSAKAPQRAVRASVPRTTTATFITPQSLVAFPFASGLVAGMWQATNALGLGDHNYTGFLIALFVGAVVYGISVSDRRLKLTRDERWVGMGIGLINCFYLFMAALGLHHTGVVR